MHRHSFRLISGRYLQHSGTGMTKQKDMLIFISTLLSLQNEGVHQDGADFMNPFVAL